MAGTVLILGGRAPVALDHARRFAHQGWKVLIADSIPCRISGASRAVSATLRLPPPRQQPLRFAQALREACERHAVDLLLPICEEVFYVARYRDQLPARTRVLAEDFGLLRELHSKWCFLEWAQGCGARVPESARVASLNEAREWAGTAPVVLKPEFSRFGVHVRLYPDGIPADAPPLADLGAWVVQRMARGTELCSYSVADRGRLVAHSLYRPQWRVVRSASFYFEPTRHAQIHGFAEAFAAKTGFTGQLSFDWIVADDGEATVLECNPRATSGVHLFAQGDALPAALAGTWEGAACVEPTASTPRMIATMMLLAGLPTAVFQGRYAQWRHDHGTARDVLLVPGDTGPAWGGLRDLGSYARIALARRCNLREASTQDIEWDGQALPDFPPMAAPPTFPASPTT